MTQRDQIWEGAIRDCSHCCLDLVDAIGFATDDAIYRVNHATGESIDNLVSLRDACKNSRRGGSDFGRDLEIKEVLPHPERTI